MLKQNKSVHRQMTLFDMPHEKLPGRAPIAAVKPSSASRAYQQLSLFDKPPLPAVVKKVFKHKGKVALAATAIGVAAAVASNSGRSVTPGTSSTYKY